jgi:hypothetical protein
MWKELTVHVNYYTQITYLVWVKAPYDPNDILTLMDGLNLGPALTIGELQCVK